MSDISEMDLGPHQSEYCNQDMDIGKLQQNVHHLFEEAFLEQGKVYSKSEAQINDLKIKLEHTRCQQKELEEKLEKREAQNEDLQRNHDHSEAQRKELMKRHEKSEAHIKELRGKIVCREANMKAFLKKVEHIDARNKEHEITEKALKEELDSIKLQQSETQNKKLQLWSLDDNKTIKDLLEEKEKNEKLDGELNEMRNYRNLLFELMDHRNKLQKKEEELINFVHYHLEKALLEREALSRSDALKNGLKKTLGESESESNELKEKHDHCQAQKRYLQKKDDLSEAELQEARQELINGLAGLNFCTSIGVKKMGELDNRPFQSSCKREYSIKEADDKAETLYSQWDGYLRDPSWYPFTTIIDSGGNSKVTINEEDEKLKQLKISNLDGEVYNAVTTALVELKSYNTVYNNRRTAIAELWNFKERRKASLKEGILYVLNQMKLLRRRVGRMLSEQKKLDVKKKYPDDGIFEIQKKLEEKEAELKDLKAELEYSHELNSTLSVKEHENNDEPQKKMDELQKIIELEDHKDHAEKVSDEDESVDQQYEEMVEIRKKLKNKEEELADVEDLNNTLIIKELKSNTELQEARTELIRGWESASHAFIGIKRMGELDSKSFQTACKRKYPTAEADDQAAALCSLWENYVWDPNWHPFRISTDSFGQYKEIINEEDEKLKKLKNEFGVEVHLAVSTALLELNEYNRSGRYPVNELWNYEEDRRASIKEVILHILKQLKLQKRRRT